MATACPNGKLWNWLSLHPDCGHVRKGTAAGSLVVCRDKQNSERLNGRFKACLHGGGGPQVGEVTSLGGVTRLSM